MKHGGRGGGIDDALGAVVRTAIDDALVSLRAELRELVAVQSEDDGLLSIAHAAEYLDVSAKTIKRAIAAGTLRAFGKGRLQRVRKRDLLLVLDSEGADVVHLEDWFAEAAKDGG